VSAFGGRGILVCNASFKPAAVTAEASYWTDFFFKRRAISAGGAKVEAGMV
jgi:hypothetical protein